MPPHTPYCFGPFRLDVATRCLWRGEQLLPFPPKPFDVLACLVANAGEVVTKETLLDTVWPETSVTEGVLKTCMREIRQRLGEAARAPQYVATVHGRGYRFIADVAIEEDRARKGVVEHKSASDIPPVSSTSLLTGSPPALLAREAELSLLRQRWARALQGERQMVFVTGEPGIGKTALVETFIAEVAATGGGWVGYGQCVEPYGLGEPYLPLLEALGRLGRGSGADELVTVLRQQAPSWLLNLPSLLPTDELDKLQRRASTLTQERMLRELTEALETWVATSPLVLLLEDLHWSDGATVAWLSYIARRRDPARLFILGTYRPVETIVQSHPLHALAPELRRLSHVRELSLDYLPESSVAVYLRQRLGEVEAPAGLTQMLHQRTNGNPLFLITFIDELIRQRVLRRDVSNWHWFGGLEAVNVAMPRNLMALIEHQLKQLDAVAQRVLETASISGMAFTTAAVAAGADLPVEEVEAICDTLARQEQFIRAREPEVWPDGTLVVPYFFFHALYQDVLYQRVSANRRTRLHRQIGLRLEQGYGSQARQIAAELAEHFLRGRDTLRAVQYLCMAGENAIQRHAHHDAIGYLSKGIDLLGTAPESVERLQQEIALQLTLGGALLATKGYAAAEVEDVYTRAQELCQQMGSSPRLLQVLLGLQAFYIVRGKFQMAQTLGEQCLRLAQSSHNPTRLLNVHYSLGLNLFHLGEFVSSRAHLERGFELYEPHERHIHRNLQDPGVVCLSYGAWTLWWLGYPEQAVHRIQAAVNLAQQLDHPFSLAFALYCASFVYMFRGEASRIQEPAQTALRLATEHGFAFWRAGTAMIRGSTLVDQGQREEGIVEIRQGLAAWRGTGAEIGLTYWPALLADVYGRVGQMEEGLAALVEAFTAGQRTGERFWEAELYRLKGELQLGLNKRHREEAENGFRRSLEIAQGQEAKSLELRAALSLSRVWQQQGKRVEAYELLAPIYAWFTEGFDTADLQAAKALLDEL